MRTKEQIIEDAVKAGNPRDYVEMHIWRYATEEERDSHFEDKLRKSEEHRALIKPYTERQIINHIRKLLKNALYDHIEKSLFDVSPNDPLILSFNADEVLRLSEVDYVNIPTGFKSFTKRVPNPEHSKQILESLNENNGLYILEYSADDVKDAIDYIENQLYNRDYFNVRASLAQLANGMGKHSKKFIQEMISKHFIEKIGYGFFVNWPEVSKEYPKEPFINPFKTEIIDQSFQN